MVEFSGEKGLRLTIDPGTSPQTERALVVLELAGKSSPEICRFAWFKAECVSRKSQGSGPSKAGTFVEGVGSSARGRALVTSGWQPDKCRFRLGGPPLRGEAPF
ncbi:hypothetical protein [Bradyrhizobium genosp. P]|uniref:hypothetical protein n=1 Tax=Bradyrhizobium genosp. P TaxID=83641 RepID=UPI003CED32C8